MLNSILLTLFSFWGLYAALSAIFYQQLNSWSKRDYLLFIISVWGFLLALQIEFLSLAKSLDRNRLIFSWGIITTISWGIWLLRVILDKEYRSVVKFKPPDLFKNYGSWDWIYVGIIIFILFTLALVAYVYPPNNFDSMTYHLPRVMHWVQDHSLYPYATSIERQIQLQPLAELMILNIYLLSGTDRFFNFIQLGALFVCLIGISNIASKLGLDSRLQLITVLLCISIPMALLQATSTQNDLVSACWLVCFVAAGLSLIKEPTWFRAIPTGFSLGLALLTKATAYIFALPFCIFFGIMLLRRIKARALYIGAFICFLALLINAGHYSRMWLVYKSPLGPSQDYRNELISINALASNAIRNVALNFIPSQSDLNVPVELNQYVQNWLRLAHIITGLAPDDPRTSWPYSNVNVFNMVNKRQNEDNIGNPLHTALIFLTIFTLIIKLSIYKKEHLLLGYILCLVCAFGLYCLIFRWQEWGTRLFLPVLILWMPVVVNLLFSYQKKWILFVPVILAIIGINIVFLNPLRPIVPPDFDSLQRFNYIFNWNKPAFEIYKEISQRVTESGCNQVGLQIGSDTWEYPFWTILKKFGFSGRIEHIHVKNPTAKFEDLGFQPCAVIIQYEEPEAYSAWEKYDYGDLNLYVKQ
jgi:hypothetical protein